MVSRLLIVVCVCVLAVPALAALMLANASRNAERAAHRSDARAEPASPTARALSSAIAPVEPLSSVSVPAPPTPVWSDEFDGPAGAGPDPARWSFDVGGGGWGNDELQSYTKRPGNASLNGQGDLVITARRESYTGSDGIARHYTSARLQTLHTFQFLFGRMEARIRVPSGTGLLPAFWALGNDAYNNDAAWPGCGEIDAMEVVGSKPSELNGTVHGPWSWAPDGIGGRFESATPLSAGFHVYGVQWSPGEVKFMIDGAVYADVRQFDLPPGSAWPFQHPEFLLLDLAVGGEWPGAPAPTTSFPALMVVDWVRVWR